MAIFNSYVKLPEGTTFTAELRIQKRAMHAYLYWMAAPSRSGSPETTWDTELVACFL